MACPGQTSPEATLNLSRGQELVLYFIVKDSTERKGLRGQTAGARRTTILQPMERKPHSQKDRQNEKAEDCVPDEGTR